MRTFYAAPELFTMTERKCEWVVVKAGSDPREVAECMLCGEILRVKFPMEALLFIRKSEEFIKRHSECVEQVH